MATLSAYLKTWRLKLIHAKTVMAAFHLHNPEVKRELKVYANGKLLPFFPVLTYLRVKLDWSLTFRHHLETLRKKLATSVTLLRRLAGSGWDAGAKTLRTAAPSLVYSTAEYCAPVWCCRAHTRYIDSVLNDALRIVTGYLRPMPKDHLPILPGIQPVELRRLGETLSLARRGTLDPDHILLGQPAGLPDLPQERLKSRRPFAPASWKLLNDLSKLGIRAAQRTNYRWSDSSPNEHTTSMFSFPESVLGLLEWACQEHLGISSFGRGLALSVTDQTAAPYIGHLEGWLVWRFWVTTLDAGSIPPQPVSDPIGFSDASPYEEEAYIVWYILQAYYIVYFNGSSHQYDTAFKS